MSDIVGRLRKIRTAQSPHVEYGYNCCGIDAERDEAANEITRLREANKELYDALEYTSHILSDMTRYGLITDDVHSGGYKEYSVPQGGFEKINAALEKYNGE